MWKYFTIVRDVAQIEYGFLEGEDRPWAEFEKPATEQGKK